MNKGVRRLAAKGPGRTTRRGSIPDAGNRPRTIAAESRGPRVGLAAGPEVFNAAGRDNAGLSSRGERLVEIHGAGGTQGPQPIYPRLAAFSVEAGGTVHAGVPRDQVEISPLGQMLDGIGRLPEIRHEKVEEIRRQIASGTYETSAKLETALDRLIDELHGF